MSRTILTTIGSLGDLHPFIAIGRALVSRGEQVVLAVPDDAVPIAHAAGLAAVPILPSFDGICRRLGLTSEELARRVIDRPHFVIDEIMMPALQDSAAALDELVDSNDILAGSLFALATEIVAEKRLVPLATILLQPMTLFSAWQPPVAPGFAWMRHHPQGRIGRGWNRIFYALARAALRRRYGKAVDAVRMRHGLGPRRRAVVLERGAATRSMLCCWSSALGALPPDAPQDAVLTGLPFFDEEGGGEAALHPALDAFLEAGDAPLVFTLGSFVVNAAGEFYEQAAAVGRKLGRRSILLTGQPGPPRRDGDCLVMRYAPHSALFPHVAAVIHHGGIGTTGQALRAGRVQLIVPHFGDQFDNADRMRAAGVGLTILPAQFGSNSSVDAIARMLSSAEMAASADRAARIVAAEDGTGMAARQISRLRR